MSTKRIMALTALLIVGATPVGAQDVGALLKGGEIAQQIRAEGERRSPNAQAPTFETVATTPGMTSIALTAALRTSHRAMPNIALAGDDQKNVIAYILSLR